MTELRSWQQPLSEEAKARLARQFERMGRYYRHFDAAADTITSHEIRALFRASQSDYTKLRFHESDGRL